MRPSKDHKGRRASKVISNSFLFSRPFTRRPDDSAVRVDQQEWGAAGQKPVPPGHSAGGPGHPGALPRRAGCAVSSLLRPPSFQEYCFYHHSRTLP